MCRTQWPPPLTILILQPCPFWPESVPNIPPENFYQSFKREHLMQVHWAKGSNLVNKMKLRVRSLLWVLQLLATIHIIFLHAIAFNSSRNSNQGWTHSSNIIILSCSLYELNEGRTKEILFLAIRPISLLILI